MAVESRRRSGSSLAELLVAMTLLAIIGGAAAAAIRMQTGIHLRVGKQTAAAAQLREAVAPLIGDLATAAAGTGDLAVGGALDTTLDLRTTVGAGFVCAPAGDARSAWVVIVGRRGSGVTAGDSAWLYASGSWHPVRVAGVARGGAPGGFCSAAATMGSETVRVTVDSSVVLPGDGMPMRISRWIRYSLYRSGDGLTYLGLREWSHALGRLGTVQPVAGPFDSQASRFLYRDAAGSPLTPVNAAAEIALVGIVLSSDDRRPGPGWADSVVVALRNRP